MTAAKPSGKPFFLRRKYLIDKPTQLGVVKLLVVGLLTIAAAYVAALFVFFKAGSTEALDAQQVKTLLLKVNVAYFCLTGSMIVALVILLTHRFVGAAHVFRQAIVGMLEGDFGKRLTLRKTDFLQDIAARLTELRQRWVDRDAAVATAVDRAVAALAKGETADAVAELERLRSVTAQPAPAPSADARPRAGVEAA